MSGKYDVHALKAIAVKLERLAVQGQLVFVFDGNVVAGKDDELVVDPAATYPVTVGSDDTVYVHVVPKES